MQFRSKFLFETRSIHSHLAYKILKSTMAYQLDEKVDSITPIYFYAGNPRFLVEIENNETYCLVKFLVSTTKDIEDEIMKNMNQEEEAILSLFEEMGLSNETFLFDAKNLASVSFEDFEMNTEKKVQDNDIFCVEKGVGIITSLDVIHVFRTTLKTQAMDLSIFSLYNRLPFIQNPKNALTFSGCFLSTIISGLFSGIKFDKIQEDVGTELNNSDVLNSYIASKLGGVQVNNSHISRMISSLKINKFREALNIKDKKESVIEGEVILKEGETAFLSRIIDMGLNKFISKLPTNNGKATEVKIDIPNIGARKIWISEGAAFVIPDNKNPESEYNDLGYWISLLGSDDVCFAMS